MSDTERGQAAKFVFDFLEPVHEAIAGALVDDPQAAVGEASRTFDEMLQTLAYVDELEHPMGLSLVVPAAHLAVYLALADRGVGVHDFGQTLHEHLARTPLPEPDMFGQIPEFVAAAEASQADPEPGEFVFEVLTEGDGFDWGINITSCGICSHFSKYDAMDLVPYMCAIDDLMSDRSGDGLRRTGTIALGADHCDFRYERGGEPRRVAEHYPEQIRITTPNPG